MMHLVQADVKALAFDWCIWLMEELESHTEVMLTPEFVLIELPILPL